MEFYSAIKKNNKIILFGDKWIDLENFMLSKVSQAKKSKVACFSSCVDL
jgi:hypothetical protein